MQRTSYVLAEQVEEITEGTVRLKLSPERVEHLGEYLEPGRIAFFFRPFRRYPGAGACEAA